MAEAYEKRLLRVFDYIHDNPAGDLSLDALADVAALSRFHFHRVFRAMTGETVAQAVRRVRLYRASVALLTTGTPVAAIARQVGYPNADSFARAFADAHGLSPAAFRISGRLHVIPPTLPDGDKTMYPIEIRDEPQRRLSALPNTGSYFEIGRAYERLYALMGARGLIAQVSGAIAIGYDDPATVPAEALRSHAGLVVTGDCPLEPPLEEVILPAGRHAVMRYTGPYQGLPQAYEQFMRRWLPTSGEEPADRPAFEIYVNSPMDTRPEDLVTEICLPLKERG